MEGYFPCPTPDGDKECPYYYRTQGCHEIRGHRYWPAHDYGTTVEKIFRNLPENIDINCRRFEEESHAREAPPIKPPLEDMLQAIGESAVTLSKSKQKAVEKAERYVGSR